MNNILEIKYQNQQDVCFSLYFTITEHLYERFGSSSERVVRAAVRNAGFEMANYVKSKTDGKFNLNSLFQNVGWCFADPRMRRNVIKATEQVHLAEIYTCPFADYGKRNSSLKLGYYFCEEYQRAIVLGFTDNIAQANLSNCLSSGFDNFCRFSHYYRPANLKDSNVSKYFSEEDTASSMNTPCFKDTEFKVLQFSLIYNNLLKSAQNAYGEDGVCSIAEALREAADTAYEKLKLQSSNTTGVFDEAFIKENFPFDFSSKIEEHFDMCFLGRLRSYLNV